MKIIRTLLIIGGAAFLLPSPPESAQGPAAPASPALVSAAVNAAGDLGSFCARQPGVCSTAMSLAGTLEAKARYSIKLLYEWANGAPGTVPVGKAPASATGEARTEAPAFLMADGSSSQNTLRLEDVIPEWRDPLAIRRG